MSDRLKQLVVQAAETSRLLGVDYVPMYGGDGDGGNEIVSEAAIPQAPAPRVPPPVVAAPHAEPKPAPRPAPSLVEEVQSGGTLTMPGASWLPTCTSEIAIARTAAQAQAALDALRAKYEADAPHKNFKTAHHTIVWGEGDPKARLMFVGEAPGEEEDKTGRPFVGRAGQLLDKMIVAMGLKREQVYIANVLKTRPPGNATPTATEADLCSPYLYEQIAIIGPTVIVTLGLPASRLLLRTEATMTSLRGRWATFKLPDGRVIPVMPTYHPAYVLRSYTDEVRGKVWSDLQMAMQKLGIAAKKA